MSSAREILRKEAAAVSFLELTESQRDAVDKLSAFMKEALNASHLDPTEERRSRVALVSGMKGCGKTSLVHSLRRLMESRTVYKDFSGGDADAGLTSAAAESKSPRLGKFIKLRTELQGRFGDEFHKSDRKVTWLETLYLDPMPPGTNLTAAVLARIHAHASKEEHSRKSGLLDPLTHVDKAKHELEGLQNSAVTSLEGNLEQRAGAVDADGFSVNAMDAERQKLQVARKLNEILGSLAAGAAGKPSATQGLFVLPVDDLDVRPSRAVQMLKLASMLSIPRLFFLFLGELDAIDQVLFYETQGEYIRLLGSALESRREVAEAIEAKSNEIASSLLRKMLPPAQRLRLEPMSLGEALLYPRGLTSFDAKPTDAQPTLHRLLSDLDVPMALVWSAPAEGTPGGSGTGSESTKAKSHDRRDVLALLCPFDPVEQRVGETTSKAAASGDPKASSLAVKKTTPAEGDGVELVEATSHYDGANLLAGPPRQVADLWAELRELSDRRSQGVTKEDLSEDQRKALPMMSPQQIADMLKELEKQSSSEGSAGETQDRRNAANVIRILVDTLKSVVDEDPNPGIPVQRALKSAAIPPERTSSRLWELAPPDIQVVSTFGDRLELTFDADDGEMLSRVVGQEVIVHELHARDPNVAVLDRDAFRLLGPRSRVTYKATHDLVRLTGAGLVTKSFIHRNRTEMACTIWDDGEAEPLVIPWSSMEWPTFWHQDTYTALWNKGMAVVRRISSEQAELRGPDLALLMLMYRIAAAAATVVARPGESATIAEGLLYPEKRKDARIRIKSNQKGKGKEADEKWLFSDVAMYGPAGDKGALSHVEKRLHAILSHVADKREKGADDAEADFIDDVLLDIALLATPEVFDGFRRNDGEGANRAVRDMLHNTLTKFASDLFAEREALLPRFRRLRLERIGPHIGTLLGVALVAPDKIGGDSSPVEKLATRAKSWVGTGSTSNDHHLEFNPHELNAFFRRQERLRFPGRTAREAWDTAKKELGVSA